MANETPGAAMLLEGMDAVRVHVSEWGRRPEAVPAENLASGWIVGLITEQIDALKSDPAKMAVIDQVAPSYLEMIRDIRLSRGETLDG
jgi:hypothetical protein